MIRLIYMLGIIGYVLSFQLSQLQNRIVGGEDVKIKEVPYQLSLYYLNTFVCGASIIDSEWAITAAHCVKGRKASTLRVGAGNEIRNNGQFYNILKVIAHSKYSKKTFDNDIALLKIDGSFSFGDKVKAVNLPNAEPATNSNAIISGWGSTKEINAFSETASTFPETLKKTTVKIIDRNDCQTMYNKCRNCRKIIKNMFCAGDVINGGKDACANDSGGPLVSNNKLYGIISWGNGCGDAKYPGVYTNVANHRSWIKKNAKI